MHSSVFMVHAEEKKAVLQWERFINFNRRVKTVAYVKSIERIQTSNTCSQHWRKRKKRKQQSSGYHSENSLVKRWNLWKLKGKFQKAAKSNKSHHAKGRICKSQLDFNAKHPKLLHWKHHAFEIFLRNEHNDNQHEGTEHVRNIVQQKMLILGIKSALRWVKNKCVTCRKGSAQTGTPVMADLPDERLDTSTAFTNVGVYFFGSFNWTIGRRNEKRWCCLFTCLTMRVVHIEVVPKLDTDSCFNAVMRFIVRRGKPSTIISDNGTNFVGAEREFEEYVAMWNKEGIEEHLIQRGIRWKINPTAAPHSGVVWERIVRSCQKTMYALLGNRSVTEDVFSTTFFQCVLLSRPWTQDSRLQSVQMLMI